MEGIMMLRVFWISCLACSTLIITSAFAGEYVMQLQPNEAQQVRMDAGVETVDSITTASAIRFIEPTGPFKKRAVIQIMFLNSGQRPFNVGPENVTAQLADGTVVPIIGYDQLAREEKRRQGWAHFGAALQVMGNSLSTIDAGNTYGSAIYSGNIGGYGYSGIASYSGHDATAAAIAGQTARRENELVLERFNARRQQGDVTLAQSLQTTTVDPNIVLDKQVTFEMPAKVRSAKNPVTILFTISAGEDHHIVKTVAQKSN
jgi:hypothetical protein